MTHSILVIEDNPDITRVLQDILANAGYRPTTTSSGLDGLSAARELNPDLIVLDLGLPDINGGEVARRVRQYSSVPIIILTAVDVVDRKVDLLEAGVNDYITKPFDPDELLARINVQFRRQEQEAEAVLQVGELCIQVAQRRCTFASREITLTAREFDLLLLLARPPARSARVRKSKRSSGKVNYPSPAVCWKCTCRICARNSGRSTLTA